MRVVNLYGPDNFRIDEVPRPSVGPRDALLRVMVCGICGSDLGYVATGGVLGPAERAMPLGHELSAVVEEVGAEVPDIHPGMRVAVNPMGAGNAIGNGGPEGGFADYLLVRNAADGGCLFPLSDSITPYAGALVEPLAVALHAVKKGGAEAGAKVAIFGVGPIGLGTIPAFKARGAADIVAVDLSHTRLDLARQLGANAALHPEEGSVWEQLRARHGEVDVFGTPASGTDILVDATGSGAVLQEMIAGAGPNAHLVVVGLHKQPVPIDFAVVLMKELSISGSMAYPEDEFSEVISMLEQGMDVSPLISERFSLAAFPEAFAAARNPEHGAKIMVEISLGTQG